MEEILKYAPIVNTGIFLITAAIFLLRLNDVVRRFQVQLDSLMDRQLKFDHRLTVLETFCSVKHPPSAE